MMTVFAAALIGAASLAPVVRCIAFPGAQPTSIGDNTVSGSGWTPKPTEAPRVDLRRDLALAKAKRSYDTIDYDYCGWTSGDIESWRSCEGYNTCMFYTPSGVVGMAGCCTTSGDYQDCGWNNACIDYKAIQSSSCDLACYQNNYLKRCTASTAPYCVSLTYPGPAVQDFECGTDDGSTWIMIETTAFSSGGYESYYSSYDSDETWTLQPQFVPQAALTGWQSTWTPASGASGSASPSAASASARPSETGESSKSHVGAIAGGAVAGTVVICAAIGAAVFFFLRGRKKTQNKQQGSQMQHMQMGSPPTGQDGAHGNPHAQSMYVPDNKLNSNLQYYAVPQQGYGPHSVSPSQDSPMAPYTQHMSYMPHQQMPMGVHQMPGHQPMGSPSMGTLQRDPSGASMQHTTGSMSPPQQSTSPAPPQPSTSPRPPSSPEWSLLPGQHPQPVYEMGDHR